MCKEFKIFFKAKLGQSCQIAFGSKRKLIILMGTKIFSSIPKFQKQPPEVFCKKAILKNFTIFTGKPLCWILFLIKLQAFRPANLLKRDSNTRVFLRILKILKNSYFEEHLRTVAAEIQQG